MASETMEQFLTLKSDEASELTPLGGTDSECVQGQGHGQGQGQIQVPLKSIQPYRTKDEFLVAMREDLAEWFNLLYGFEIDETTLFDHLSTGILLCQHANAFNDMVKSNASNSTSFSSASNISSSSSTAVPVSGHVIQYNRNAQRGSFHSRVNISNFLSWCRSALGLRDTLLFETEDLVQGRNERNVVLCLLEVARRGARIGMLAPSLVQLEAEIDEEIRRDSVSASGDDATGLHSYGPRECSDMHGKQFDELIDVAVQTVDDLEELNVNMVQKFLGYSSESIYSSESSYKHHHTPTKVPPPARPTQTPSLSSSSNAHNRHVRRPVIEVDLMSLDEMVRKALSRCTCEFQYPMIRVSEGKYRIGETLTFIFVRILRNHVMVRIGGGWDTLENYLNRHDPCRMEIKGTKTGSHQSRGCAHSSGIDGQITLAANSSAGDGGGLTDDVKVGKDGADGNASHETFQQESRDCISEKSVSQGFHATLANRRIDDNNFSEQIALSHSQFGGVEDDVVDIASTCTRVTLSGKVLVDVACQTDQELFMTRRYSSSSGASSLEPTNERLEIKTNKTKELSSNTGQSSDMIMSDDRGRVLVSSNNLSNQSQSVTTNLTDKPADTAPKVQRKTSSIRSHSKTSTNEKPRPGSAQDSRRQVSVKDNRHVGERPSSAQDKRHRTDRPVSAQNPVSRTPSIKDKLPDARSTCPTITEQKQEVSSSFFSSSSFSDKRQTKPRPASAQQPKRSHPSTPKSQSAVNRAPAPDQRVQIVHVRRPASARDQLHQKMPSRAEEDLQNGSNTKKSSLLRDSFEKCSSFEIKVRELNVDVDSSPKKTSQVNLIDENRRKVTTVHRRRSLNNIIPLRSTKVKLVKEVLYRNSGISQAPKPEVYIPEATESPEDGQFQPEAEKELVARSRPRKDVERSGSITKIPKPIGLCNS